MTRTNVASATKEIIIGFDQPFCVIGERINPTGRKKLAAEMQAGNFDTVIKDALEQVAAGATMLDVNAGVTSVNPNETEPGLLVQTMEIVQGLVDVPLAIDSSVTAAIEAALKVAKGRPLVNSVTGEEEKLEAILPLCAKYNVPVVAISNDETGISQDPDVRFAVAKKIVERAMDYGIKPHDIVVDPLVMPIGAIGSAGLQVFALGAVQRFGLRREERGGPAFEHGIGRGGVRAVVTAEPAKLGIGRLQTIQQAVLHVLEGREVASRVMTAFGHEDMDSIVPVKETPFSGFVTISRGCDNYCTYCIVPYVRGRERECREYYGV